MALDSTRFGPVVAAAVVALTAVAAVPAQGAPADGASRFASCEAFAGHMRTQAQRIVGPHGLPGTPQPLLLARQRAGAMPEAMPAAPADAAAAPVAGRDYSDTNLQEAGVDEPDIVKSDGRTLFTLIDGRLRAVAIGGDGPPRTLGTLDLSRLGADRLLLFEGRLLALGAANGARPQPATARMAAADMAAATSMPVPMGPARTIVVEIDISDPSKLRPIGRVTADGGLVVARRTDGSLRLVLSNQPRAFIPIGPRAATPAAERAARSGNRRAIARTGAAAWLPRLTVQRRANKRTVTRVMSGCRSVARPATFSGLGMVTILTLSLERGLTVTDSDTLLTDAETVYASPRSLYVATPRWVNPEAPCRPPTGTTRIHRFDITSPTTTVPAGQATVRGYPLNQFSLSEHDGHLRVATTEEPSWWQPTDERSRSESRVTILAQRGDRLEQTGVVTGLGPGERIYAVRFLGPRAYVVTFRQTDPLYSLDLSDPANPRKTGELKINGYSAYLHPIDDNTLIGIGQDATDQGALLGTQVSLFDVSDPARPTRIAQRLLGEGGSEAEHDHLAVLYWPATGTLVVPFQSYGRGRSFSGAVGLNVGRSAGVSELGRVAHPNGAQVRRAVVVGDALYTVSTAGTARHSIGTLAAGGFAPFD